ncbi:hypothetical protein OSB04_un001405 [Centaurea solstitialis]|uniref:Retrotransposon gag domain-containing protein n=1 Tax=Centaurea solstitialis TaxID=347529 RepID=A0AA38S284_9ASTR|nr:hypothetical protein OSB04_un001405 [Centaurea solstitialis]
MNRQAQALRALTDLAQFLEQGTTGAIERAVAAGRLARKAELRSRAVTIFTKHWINAKYQTPDIAQLVAQQVQNAIPNIVTQVTAGIDNRRRSGGDQSGEGEIGRNQGCTYKTFITNPRPEAANNLSGRLQETLIEEYCPKSELQKLEAEFWNHSMKGMGVGKYTARFHELAQLVPHMVTPEEKRIDRDIWGLAPEIRRMVTSANPNHPPDAVVLANRLAND